jgi:hypothetical protein
MKVFFIFATVAMKTKNSFESLEYKNSMSCDANESSERESKQTLNIHNNVNPPKLLRELLAKLLERKLNNVMTFFFKCLGAHTRGVPL